MRRMGSVLAAGALVLSGCFTGATETAAPSSRVAALTAAATATAGAPTSTPIVLPTATPGPTRTATQEPDASDDGGPRLAPPSGRPAVGPASRATELPAPSTAPPSSALVETATPRPFPTLPPGNPLLIPTPTPGEAAAVDERSRPLIERASQMLAGELGIAVEDVSLVLLEAVLWPDGGLGCATPDMIVQPVETPGYRIVLEVAGTQYEYHTDLDNQVVRCEIGRPRR